MQSAIMEPKSGSYVSPNEPEVTVKGYYSLLPSFNTSLYINFPSLPPFTSPPLPLSPSQNSNIGTHGVVAGRESSELTCQWMEGGRGTWPTYKEPRRSAARYFLSPFLPLLPFPTYYNSPPPILFFSPFLLLTVTHRNGDGPNGRRRYFIFFLFLFLFLFFIYSIFTCFILFLIIFQVPIEAENMNKGKLDIVCKAVDTSYNTQPDTVDHVSFPVSFPPS